MLRPKIRFCSILVIFVLLTAPSIFAVTITQGTDHKVSNDNLDSDGGIANVTPSFDAQNRQENETTIAISPIASPVTGKVGDILAMAANDYRMVPWFADSWMPVYVSFDGGKTWFLPQSSLPSTNGFNTFVPGFPTDTSAEGLASPIHGIGASGDPVVRFDRDGNLFAAALAFNRTKTSTSKLNTVSYIARYNYSPGTLGSGSTPTSAGEPPNFTYAGTTIVKRGSVGFGVPLESRVGNAGTLIDKEWMEIDRRTSGACSGDIYYTFTPYHGQRGSFPIRFTRSSDGGKTFSKPKPITTGSQAGTVYTQGSDIAVGIDGTVYVAYRTFTSNKIDQGGIQIVSSKDCGKHWSNPAKAGSILAGQAPGVLFRTPTFAFIATDDTNANVVYIAYQNFTTNFDIYVQRSTDKGKTWGAPVKVNDDTGTRHQIFPTIKVSNGVLHVAWYDFRLSTTAANEKLDVFYACSNCSGVTYPSFSANQRVSDVSHNGNCLMFGGGTAAFHGDYIELDAHGNTAQISWADNRDVTDVNTCTTVPFVGDNTGHRNQNVYMDTVTVSP
jgi:hypothetical protein